MKIPVYEPALTGNEKKYVIDCLDSNWISSKGKYVGEFENKFSEFTNIKYSVATSNGTTALHLAMLALGIGPNDEVIVPTFTYIASVNAITYVGATPIFVDSSLDTWQLDLDEVKKRISSKTKAILAVHIYGNTVDLDILRELCNQHHLYLIEDCSEAIGTLFKNRHVGAEADIATFSFFGNKTITTGEGGMVCTNNSQLRDRVELFKGQGVSKSREYWHEVIGYNYRMTNICAAIGVAQLEKIDEILEKKLAIAEKYQHELSGLPIRFASCNNVRNAHWMVSFIFNNDDQRDLLRHHLSLNGIETRPFFHPIHLMVMYKNLILEDEYFPNAINLSNRGINLPSSPNLTMDQITFICDEIKKIIV